MQARDEISLCVSFNSFGSWLAGGERDADYSPLLVHLKREREQDSSDSGLSSRSHKYHTSGQTLADGAP
jgi:hypothetical protein